MDASHILSRGPPLLPSGDSKSTLLAQEKVKSNKGTSAVPHSSLSNSIADLTGSILSNVSNLTSASNEQQSDLSLDSSINSFFGTNSKQNLPKKGDYSSGVMYVFEDESLALTSLKASSDLLLVFDRTDDGAFRVESGALDEFGPTVIRSRVIKKERYYGVLGIIDLQFVKLVAVATKRKLVGHIAGKPVWNVTEGTVRTIFCQFYTKLEEDELLKTSEKAIKSVLNSGQLYYAPGYDLTSTLQENYERLNHINASSCPLEHFNETFLYNYSWLQPFLTNHTPESMSDSFVSEERSYHEFVLAVIIGFVETRHIMPPLLETTLVYAPQSPGLASEAGLWHKSLGAFLSAQWRRRQGKYSHDYRSQKTQSKQTLPGLFTISVISRYTRMRHGGSVYVRGLDEFGNAACYAETETIVYQAPSYVMSWVQVRGSIPLLWRERLTSVSLDFYVDSGASAPFASLHAAGKHFERLMEKYGGPIVCIDTIGSAARIQEPLSDAFAHTVYLLNQSYESSGQFLPQVPKKRANSNFGYPLIYSRQKFGDWNALRNLMNETIQSQGFFFVSEGNLHEPLMRQSGVYRVNDFNCVDETNVVQYWLAKGMIIYMFEHAARQSSMLDVCSPVSATSSDGFSFRSAGPNCSSTGSKHVSQHENTFSEQIGENFPSTASARKSVDTSREKLEWSNGRSSIKKLTKTLSPTALFSEKGIVRILWRKTLWAAALLTQPRLLFFTLNAVSNISNWGQATSFLPVKSKGFITDVITCIGLDPSSLATIGNLFADNGDVISRIYVNTNAYYGHLIRQSQFSYILYPLSHVFLGVSRVYVRLFVEVQRHDVIHTFLGPNAIAVGIPTPRIHELMTQLNMIRRHVQRMRYCQPWYVAGMFFVKRYFAPYAIHNPFQLLCALVWLLVFWIYRVWFKLPPILLVGMPREQYLLMPTVRRNSFRHFNQELRLLEFSPTTLAADRRGEFNFRLKALEGSTEDEIECGSYTKTMAPRIPGLSDDSGSRSDKIPLLRPGHKSVLYPEGLLKKVGNSTGDPIDEPLLTLQALGSMRHSHLNAIENVDDEGANGTLKPEYQWLNASLDVSSLRKSAETGGVSRIPNDMGLLSELATVVSLRSAQTDINKQGLILTYAKVHPDSKDKRYLKFRDPAVMKLDVNSLTTEAKVAPSSSSQEFEIAGTCSGNS